MIIYVYPDGEAHTKDQAQRVANAMNELIYGTLGERIREVARLFGEFMQPLADNLQKAFKAAREAVEIIQYEIEKQLEPSYRPINHYQRIYQAKNAGRHSRDQYHNKMKHASRSQRKPFKVFQRKI